MSLDIFEEMLADNPVLDRIYQSLEKEESEPVPNCHGEIVYKCIDHFVESELDMTNKNPGGLGREDEEYPRLGYYLRSTLENFSSDNMLALKMLLFDLLKSGYDFMVLMESSTGGKLKKPTVVVLEPLFLKWIDSIYKFNVQSLGPAAALFRDKFTKTRLKRLAEELKPFGLLQVFAQDANLQHTFRMYIVAGLVLRLAEAYYH